MPTIMLMIVPASMCRYVCKKWCVLPIKFLLCKMVCTVEESSVINYC